MTACCHRSIACRLQSQQTSRRSVIHYQLTKGQPLSTLEGITAHYRGKCREYEQLMMVDFLDTVLQACYNLQGYCAESPLILTGSVMVEEELIEKASKEHLATGYLFIYVVKYFLVVYLL